eukprot:24745-Eustigmatos_ZCMA.PRE.1
MLDGESRFKPIVNQPVRHAKFKGKRIALARLRGVAQQQDDVRVACVFHLERSIASKAMLRQRVKLPTRVAPAADLAVHEMPPDEGKQQRIAAADFGGVGPVGRLGPEED